MGNQINSKAKNMIIVSLMGTISLIIGGLLYLNMSGEGFRTPQGMLVLSVIILGIISFLAILTMKSIKGKYVAKLNKEYDLAFEEIRQYIGVSALSFTEKRELTTEILSLFLEAQKDGKTVDRVIGEDHKQFIDDMIEAYGVKNYLVHDLLTGLQYFIFYLLAVSLLLFFEGNQENYFHLKIDYSLMFFFVISAFLIIPSINSVNRRSIRNSKNTAFLPISFMLIGMGFVGGFIVLMRVLRRYFIDIRLVENILNDGAVIINSPVTLFIMIIGIPAIQLIKRGLRRKSI